MRSLVWRLLWGAAFLVWVPRFSISGEVPTEPVIFAASHCSHADTAALQLALARKGHRRVLAAGAEDYWFASPARRAASKVLGVFPFPRSGGEGIRRSRRLIADGHSLIIFPQGSRAGGVFRPGIGHIAEGGTPVVPVAIDGTDRLLPKGRSWPRRSEVSLRFCAPISRSLDETAIEFAQRLERQVVMRNARAEGRKALSMISQGQGRRIVS